ncbi:histidine phosphatase superfamily [Scheffersomyces amazonensis]|uniref:histidine phosphatase superfamily n=1 Tax=Scheffersomyces amazonensis TaxID=1078765 RepID=UPI00315CFB39
MLEIRWVVAVVFFELIVNVTGLYLPTQQVQQLENYHSFKVVKPPYLYSIDHYFQQHEHSNEEEQVNEDAEISDINNIGLKPHYTWDKILDDIRHLNKKHKKHQFKLFFLQRHGEGWHNYAMEEKYNSTEWKCYWQLQSGDFDGTIEWDDAELTPKGKQQVDDLSKQFSLEGIPKPSKYFVSPLRRTLETWERMWRNSKENSVIPVVKEKARETYGIGTESKRHNKTYIIDKYPYVEFEAGFSEQDELWSSAEHESSQHRNWRVQQLLIEIFEETHEDDDIVISLVSHSGTISSILKVIGHKKWKLPTGSMIPVVIGIDWTKGGKTYKLNKPWKTFEDYCPSN